MQCPTAVARERSGFAARKPAQWAGAHHPVCAPSERDGEREQEEQDRSSAQTANAQEALLQRAHALGANARLRIREVEPAVRADVFLN